MTLKFTLLILKVLELLLSLLVLLSQLEFEGMLLRLNHMLELTFLTASFLEIALKGTNTLEIARFRLG